MKRTGWVESVTEIGEMMEIGEAVAVLIETPSKCPFCDSKAAPTFETKEMENDASVLARNSGGMSAKSTKNPEAEEDYYIYEKYWDSDDRSKIVMSPHHVIPGNASLARCPEILKWMAGTTSVKKLEHSKTTQMLLKKVMAKVQRLSKSQKAAKLPGLFNAAFAPRPLKESADGMVVFALDAGRVDSHTKPVTDNFVIGQIAYDVNDRPNCVWLPSHCAIETWSDMEGVGAWHERQNSAKDPPVTFHVAYAYNTMRATGVQFHDAHPDYSIAVIEELKKLDIKLKDLATKCHQHPSKKSKKGGPYPAPATLTNALYKLAEVFVRQLTLKTTKPAAPWYTSDLALQVAALK